MTDHNCIQGPRILRLETDAAAAEAERRKLREDISRKMDQVASEIVGLAAGAKLHNDALRTEVELLAERIDRLDQGIAARLRAAFGRIDELRALLGAEGHA